MLKKMESMKKVTVARQLTDKEIKDVEVIIMEEKDNKVKMKIPYNEDIKNILLNFSAQYKPEEYVWFIIESQKSDFVDRMSTLKVPVRYLADKPKGNLFLMQLY
jgi:hypothetical protein